jgi:exodeoxyribonuclease V gamma subunit
MEIHHAADAAHLAAQLAELWSGPRDDPFSFDLAVVPSAGFQRWLSQQLAVADGTDGICAGVTFTTASRLRTQLFGAQDPWRPHRLAWLIQRIVLDPTCPAELSVVREHLDASRETYSATTRIAGHFLGYAEHLPAMLQAWARGEDLGPLGAPLGDNAWQAQLWRLLAAEIGTDPVQQRSAVLAQLRHAPVAELSHRIAVLAPAQLNPASWELYRALSTHHQLDLLLLNHCPSRRPTVISGASRSHLQRPSGHPLNLSLGSIADELAGLAPVSAAVSLTSAPRPDNLLGWLAEDLFYDRQPVHRTLRDDDHSVQVHLSHGPSRQVEVLREVLAQLLAGDPTLEPRHIAILTPDVETLGPLLDAAFTPQPGIPTHPAQQFRIRLADQTLAQVNPLVGLLLTLLRLPDSRIEASALLELCATEPVANRFGFNPEVRERLAVLVNAAGIRWGLNATQRADYGLGGFAHNTWLAGLQRMLLGVALSEQDLVAAGTVLPLDDVDSSDIAVIGALTELIGRLSRWLTEIGQTGTVADWVSRCRGVLDAVTSLPMTSEWQLADLLAGLARLDEAADACGTTKISRQAIVTAIEHEFRTSPARGAFGNGSAIVAGLESLRNVPHRVIVLLGWDADRFPRTGRRHGDDLLGIDPPVGAPSPALSDRGALLDAIHAATEQLVIIGRGRSEATNERVPLAAPITELLEALDATAATASGTPAAAAVTVQHPLQPFAVEYFTAGSGLSSVDVSAFRAATASLHELLPHPNRFALTPLPPPDFSQGVNLDDLTGFYRHPAKSLLKTRTGISLGESDQPSDEIPVDPDGLQRWQIGNRVLRRLDEGLAPQLVERAEWLGGQVPPFELGRQVMTSVLADARRTLAGAPPPGSADQHDLTLIVPVPQLGEVNLVGRVATREHTLWQVEFSSLQPRQKLGAWLRLLALAAAEPDQNWDARVIGKGYRVRYVAPSAPIALDLLGRYLAIYSLGLTRPLPAMPRLNAEWAHLRAAGRDPHDPYVAKGLRRCWDWESDLAWGKFFSYPAILTLPADEFVVPGSADNETTLLGALATSIWTPLLAAEAAS